MGEVENKTSHTYMHETRDKLNELIDRCLINSNMFKN